MLGSLTAARSTQPFDALWNFTMRITSLVVLFVLTVVLTAKATAAQCDCMGASEEIRGTRYSTAYQELKHSDAVFYGQVVEMKMIDRKPSRDGADNYDREIKFRVERAWRKNLPQYVTIRDYSDGCIIGFHIADRWLVYANFDADKNLRTHYCTRTRSADRNVDKDF